MIKTWSQSATPLYVPDDMLDEVEPSAAAEAGSP